jgi:hypothetical protein
MLSIAPTSTSVRRITYSNIATTRDSGQIQYTSHDGRFDFIGSYAANVTEETGKANVGADALGLSAVYAAGTPYCSRPDGQSVKLRAVSDERTSEMMTGGSYMVSRSDLPFSRPGVISRDRRFERCTEKSARNGYQIGVPVTCTGTAILKMIGQFGKRDDETVAGAAKTEVTGFNIGAVRILSRTYSSLCTLWVRRCLRKPDFTR